MSVPSVVGTSSTIQWALGSNVTIDTIAGIQDDDILWIFLWTADPSETPAISGFTQFASRISDNFGSRATGLWKRASSESGNYVTTSAPGGGFGFMQVTRGGSFSAPVDTYSLTDKSNSSSTLSGGAITPSVNECLIIFANLIGADTTTASWSGGGLTWTERIDSMEGTTIYSSVAAATAPQATAAAVTPSATMGVNAFANMFVVAVAPLADANVSITVPVGSMTLAGYAPTVAATQPIITIDEILRDTDTGVNVNASSVEVIVLSGSAGSRSILLQTTADIVSGVLVIPGGTPSTQYLVAVNGSSTVKGFFPATGSTV